MAGRHVQTLSGCHPAHPANDLSTKDRHGMMEAEGYRYCDSVKNEDGSRTHTYERHLDHDTRKLTSKEVKPGDNPRGGWDRTREYYQ